MGNNYRYQTAIPEAEPMMQPHIGIGLLVRAAVTASLFLALAAVGVSFLIWRSPWWELALGLALVPAVMLGVGLVLVVLRGLVLALVDHVNPGQEEGESTEEKVRLVPVNKRLLISGVDSEDLSYFVKAALGAGDWTQSRWRGHKMPSGRRCDNNYHRQIMEALVKVGIIRGYGPGSSGHAGTDVEGALRLLGLDEPNTANRTNKPNTGSRFLTHISEKERGVEDE